MKAVTITDLRKDIKNYFDEVARSNDIIVVPRNGEKEAVVIMSLAEYNSYVETNHLLSSKANADRLQRALEEMNAGQTIPFPDEAFAG